MSGIRAVAETVHEHIPGEIISICGRARCGAVRLGQVDTPTVYAGMIPLVQTTAVTIALTELPGGPADPRQVFDTAYDNPSYTLHILGEDMAQLGRVAEAIREGCDRTAHISTDYGTVNTLRVGPSRMTVRNDRPRYDVQMQVDAEIVRRMLSGIFGMCIGDTAFTESGGTASITALQGFDALGFSSEQITITEV